jgi:hypothetical protein
MAIVLNGLADADGIAASVVATLKSVPTGR